MTNIIYTRYKSKY